MKVEIPDIKDKNLLIQLPEGLKAQSTEIVEALEKRGHRVVISGDPCFGACDLRFLPGFKTVHFGHSEFSPNSNAIYVEVFDDVDCTLVAEVAVKEISEQRIGLITTIQHVKQLPAVKEVLEKAGKEVFIGEKGWRGYDGQILGCDVSTALKVNSKVDCFLYIGTGYFHPIGAIKDITKPLYIGDPYTKEIKKITNRDLEKEKALRMTKAGDAQKFGIVVSTKSGQMHHSTENNLKAAYKLKEELEAKGKECYLITVDLILPDVLLPYKLDAFVITACPRVVIDDWKNYSMPILLPEEALKLAVL